MKLQVGPAALFLFFLKVGSVLFGSGYVLLAFLRSDLVERWHWMTNAQLLDAVTVSQVTPGPVLTTEAGCFGQRSFFIFEGCDFRSSDIFRAV